MANMEYKQSGKLNCVEIQQLCYYRMGIVLLEHGRDVDAMFVLTLHF